jgi:hypothetical protein
VLITGCGTVSGASTAVSRMDGVNAVISADLPALEHELAEPIARLVAEVVKRCAHASFLPVPVRLMQISSCSTRIPERQILKCP